MMEVQRWFQPAEPPNSDWHAYHEGSQESACGYVRLTSNIDPIADAVPSGGTACRHCVAKLEGRRIDEPTTDEVTDEPDPADEPLGPDEGATTDDGLTDDGTSTDPDPDPETAPETPAETEPSTDTPG